jgi:hypothetical protein
MSDKSCFIRHVRCHVKFKNSPVARRQSRCDRLELSEMPLNNICDCYTVPKSHDFGYPLILILSVAEVVRLWSVFTTTLSNTDSFRSRSRETLVSVYYASPAMEPRWWSLSLKPHVSLKPHSMRRKKVAQHRPGTHHVVEAKHYDRNAD